MARALILATLFGLACTGTVARAQELVLCEVDWLSGRSLQRAVALELASIEEARLAGVVIELVDCTASSVRLRIVRGAIPIEERTVAVDDVERSARARLLAYVVGEMVLVATDPGRVVTQPPSLATPPSVVDAPPGGPVDATPSPLAGSPSRASPTPATPAPTSPSPVSPSSSDEPASRLDLATPLEVTLDSGVRWYASGRAHLQTTRLTVAIDHVVLDLRHTMGPLTGASLPVGPGGYRSHVVPFHVSTAAIGFRHAFRFGDDAFFVDALGYAGALWTPPHDGYPDSYGGRARYGVGGLEARAGLDVGLGPLRGSVTFELGYAQSRRPAHEDPLRPSPVRPVSGAYLGATLGLGWARPDR